jgi:O-antigen/teichoic acid export membrane protein
MMTISTLFLSIILMTGMDEVQNFFFFKQKKNGKADLARLMTSILQWRLLWGALILTIVMVASPILNSWFFDKKLTWITFAAAFSGTWFFQIMNQSADIYRFLFRPWPYLIITTSHIIFSSVMSISLIVWLDMGIAGYFIGLSTGAFAAAIVAWWLIRDYLDFSRLHWDKWSELLRFGSPFIFCGMAMILRDNADRLLIKYYLTFNHLGIYASSIRVAAIVSSMTGVFCLAFSPYAIELIHSNDTPRANRILALVLRYYGFCFLCFVLILTVLAPGIVKFILPGTYKGSFYMIGVLAISSVLFGFTFFSSLGTLKAQKTYLYSISVIVAAIITVLLNLWLIPLHGLFGAAVASASGMLILAFLSFYSSHRSWPIMFDYATLILQIIFCLLGLLALHINFLAGGSFENRFLILVGFLLILTIISVRKGEISKFKSLMQQFFN